MERPGPFPAEKGAARWGSLGCRLTAGAKVHRRFALRAGPSRQGGLAVRCLIVVLNRAELPYGKGKTDSALILWASS